MVLQLRYKTNSPVPLEVEGLTPDRLREMPVAEIERLQIFQGNTQVPLGDFFEVRGDPQDACQRWEGELSGVHWIGAKMTAGRVHVVGGAGRHVGSEMRGGEVLVEGDAGDWLGGAMRGGRIRVRGRAGHMAGAAYRGSVRGMTGGEILIDGDAGNELGHSMRRGLVAVAGNAGDLVGFNMLAGTVLVLGDAGIRHGAGMRRGTLALLGQHAPPILPTFRYACRYRPEIMLLLLRHLQQAGFSVPAERIAARYELYNGDLLEGGRGELLLPA